MIEYLYLLTFFSWIPLALLAGAHKGQRPASRVMWTLCGVTFALCGYLLYLEFVWSKTVIAPIRVDLLLLIPLATVTFTGVGVWGLRRRGMVSKIASDPVPSTLVEFEKSIVFTLASRIHRG